MFDGHFESGGHRAFGAQPVARRLADDLLAEQLQNDRQMLPVEHLVADCTPTFAAMLWEARAPIGLVAAFWRIDQLDGRVLKVATLDDKMTNHNAFPDRGFK